MMTDYDHEMHSRWTYLTLTQKQAHFKKLFFPVFCILQTYVSYYCITNSIIFKAAKIIY